MADAQSLGKGRYLGEAIAIRSFDGLTASALIANPSEPSNDILHSHENSIISLILEGDSIERVGKRTGGRSGGDLRFYRAGELHQVRIKRFPSRNINVELDHQFLRQCEIAEDGIHSTIEKDPGAKPLFLRMYRELLFKDKLTDLSIQMMFFYLFGKNEKTRERGKPEWINTLYEVLNDRWNEQFTLQDLSVAVTVHPITISKYFSRYSSCTLGEYVRRLRINKSISLVKNSSLTLTQIAFQCGFADQSHFTRTFKQLTGFLPKDFKKF